MANHLIVFSTSMMSALAAPHKTLARVISAAALGGTLSRAQVIPELPNHRRA